MAVLFNSNNVLWDCWNVTWNMHLCYPCIHEITVSKSVWWLSNHGFAVILLIFLSFMSLLIKTASNIMLHVNILPWQPCYEKSKQNMSDLTWASGSLLQQVDYLWQTDVLSHHLNLHDGILTSKCFPCYWPLVWGSHRSAVDSPDKWPELRCVMFLLLSFRASYWTNIRDRFAGNLMRNDFTECRM